MNIKEQIAGLPEHPGVYIFRDKSNSVLYVGKAVNLKKRVRSYFQNYKSMHPRVRLLASEVVTVKVMIAPTGVDALILERTLIRQYKPPYNILFRDDKEYPLLRAGLDEAWPRIEKVRRKRKGDSATYLGPFSQVGSLNKVLDAVFNAFPLVRCSEHEFQAAKRPCNYYHIKKCLGPCTLPVDQEVYRNMVRDALDIIKGKNKEVQQRLKQKMEAAAKETRYEEAAMLRDQIQALKDLQARQYMVIHEISQADIIGLYESENACSFQVMYIRDHHVWGHDSFHLSIPFQSKEAALSQFLLQYYETRDIPALVVVPFIPEDPELLTNAFKEQKLYFKKASRHYEKKLMAMAVKNAAFHHREQAAKVRSGKFVLEQLRKALSLQTLPVHMECIDISHFQGTATVASLVSFKNGKPDKQGYRLYNLADEAGKPDDYQSIREVVQRRLIRGSEQEDLPDLLLIDGGKGQLSAASEVKNKLGLKTPELAGIAKSRPFSSREADAIMSHTEERVFIPGQANPVVLETGSALYRLLTSMRDEAHRFAITHHRKRRKIVRHRSGLDSIQGIGPVLRNRLLKAFGGTDNILEAGPEQLISVKGISPALAQLVVAELKKQK